MAKVCKQAWVSGQVQGVFFRATTRDMALRFGVTGYAKNLSDGRVEVVACGEQDSVDALMNWLWEGSQQSQVTDVISKVVSTVKHQGFEIR
ncbi:acylphosphatase [Aestuariibacter halophilus]|uniref:Acylphosphatase n=1 Tax=Fluctibacter halophilus TaxID=226011 RepID=A0ABS8G509_9ALTE|nr:acylphosphatase [Aestuariibacter halophilus]MCC2615528.1 acylphosphatase [Aestuariibacter halophilus]